MNKSTNIKNIGLKKKKLYINTQKRFFEIVLK